MPKEQQKAFVGAGRVPTSDIVNMGAPKRRMRVDVEYQMMLTCDRVIILLAKCALSPT